MPRHHPDEAPRVALLIDTSSGWGRRLIRGVSSYAEKYGPWHIWVEPHGQEERLRLPHGWEGDGVIARVSSEKMADDLEATGVPVINVSGIELDRGRFPRITNDYDVVARLAAEHFLDRGFESFAYVGPTHHRFVRRHADAFSNRVEHLDANCPTFHLLKSGKSKRDWANRQQELGDWLVSLPKPVGIFSWGVTGGALVLDQCRYRGIATPDEVAVLAGDDDPLLCNITVPSLSGVLIASEQIGFRAAERLHAVLRGEADDGGVETIDPIQVSTRGSTEALAIEDDELRHAVIFIRQNAYRALTVDEVAYAVPMTRRSLERKFRQAFNRTPLEEIHRLRLARVRELLATTDLPMPAVAESAGFGTPEYMATIFKRELGLTPLRFRSQVRVR